MYKNPGTGEGAAASGDHRALNGAGAATTIATLRAFASLLILLGITVIGGWFWRLPVLTQILPDSIGMTVGVAASFILLGGALLLQTTRWCALAAAPAIAVFVAAIMGLLAHLSDAPLLIELPSLHRGLDPMISTPGRMPVASASVLALASLSLLLLRYRKRPGIESLARVLIVLVFAAGAFAMLGYLLRLELIYRWYPYTRMAIHTSIAMMGLAYALWLLWREAGAASREQQITMLGTAALVVVPLLAGMVGIGVLKTSNEDALSNDLRLALSTKNEALETLLDEYAARSEILTTRPNLTLRLRELSKDPKNAAAREAARIMVDSYVPHGFSSIVLTRLDGTRLIDAGRPALSARDEIPLHLEGPVAGSLLWNHGLVLRTQHLIRDARGVFANLVVEQDLPFGEHVHGSAAAEARMPQLLLCGIGTICFGESPVQAHGLISASSAEAGSLSRAQQGFSGTTNFREANGTMSAIAYGPVGATGLSTVMRVDATDFYGPLGRELLTGFAFVAAVTAAGLVLLRGTIALQSRRLASAELRYRHVLESLKDGVMVQDATGRVLACNASAERILWIAHDDERQGRYVSRGVVPVHEDGRVCAIAELPSVRTLASGIPENGVIVGLRYPDGATTWLSVNTVQTVGLLPHEGRSVVSSFTDITERRNAEALARQLNERYRVLVEAITDYAIVMLGANGHVISWNTGAERITGYRTGEIVGRHVSVFYPRADGRSGKPKRDLEAAQHGRFEDEGWRLRKDGSRYLAQVVITAMRDETGRLVGFSQIVHDLTERRRAEQDLVSAYRFQATILGAAPFAIIVTDPEGRITSMNPAAERMLGHRADDIIRDRRTLDFFHDPAELATRATDFRNSPYPVLNPCEALLAKTRYGSPEEREWSWLRSNGSRFPVSQSIVTLRDREDVITGFLAMAYDITERRRREERAKHDANHDFLTGLPNRALLQDRLAVALELARRDRRQIAVMMLDLDHFKQVNDTLGHHVGDELLISVAQRVLGCVRSSDTVARMGGDEFVILLGSVTDDSAIDRVARAIVDQISAPHPISHVALRVTPSIGISRYPNDGDDAEILLRKADRAMYVAKASGRQGYRHYRVDMESSPNLDLLEISSRGNNDAAAARGHSGS